MPINGLKSDIFLSFELHYCIIAGGGMSAYRTGEMSGAEKSGGSCPGGEVVQGEMSVSRLVTLACD